MCERAIDMDLYFLELVPDQSTTHEMRDEAVKLGLSVLQFVPNHYKNQEISEVAVQNDFYAHEFVSDQYKTQRMYEKLTIGNLKHGNMFPIVKLTTKSVV